MANKMVQTVHFEGAFRRNQTTFLICHSRISVQNTLNASSVRHFCFPCTVFSKERLFLIPALPVHSVNSALESIASEYYSIYIISEVRLGFHLTLLAAMLVW